MTNFTKHLLSIIAPINNVLYKFFAYSYMASNIIILALFEIDLFGPWIRP